MAMIDDDREIGRIAGRAWAERNASEFPAAAGLEAIDVDEANHNLLLTTFVTFLDPAGELADDDILDSFAAEGRPITDEYLRGWIEGVRATVAAMKQRPN